MKTENMNILAFTLPRYRVERNNLKSPVDHIGIKQFGHIIVINIGDSKAADTFGADQSRSG
jgi:hypothetical protein